MCPPGLPPQRVIAFLPSSLAGQLSRLSTGLQAPASPTSLLTTGVGVMLTPYWLVISWKPGVRAVFTPDAPGLCPLCAFT